MSNSQTTRPEAGETRYDYSGPIRAMAIHDNWVMCRRPHCAPWCLTVKDWLKLSASKDVVDQSSTPRAMHYGVLA